MNDYRYEKTAEELREALGRQVRHLRRSNEIYDQGHVEEAERIAAALYVLFADYSSNRALAKTTGVRKQLAFPDSSALSNECKSGGTFIGPYLCLLGCDGEYKPSLDGNKANWPRVPFSKWWEGAVYKSAQGKVVKRKTIIFALGNQDGGRHVDKTLRDEGYHWLREWGDVFACKTDDGLLLFLNPKWRKNSKTSDWVNWRYWSDGTGNDKVSIGLKWPPPEGAKPFKYGHWATVRQMGWEADQAFIALGL